MTIRVALADDQALVRAGFRALLNAQDDVEVVAEAADGDEAVRVAREHKPDVMLMDIRMPGTDGLAATRTISADPALSAVHILILTTFEEDEYVFEAIRVGASGFLVKDTEPAELIHAVRVVARGDALLSPGVTRRLIARVRDEGEEGPVPDHPRRADRTRTRGGRPGRRGPDERRDRRPPGGQPGNGQNPRLPSDDQTKRPRPRPTGSTGLRVRPGPPRLVRLTARVSRPAPASLAFGPCELRFHARESRSQAPRVPRSSTPSCGFVHTRSSPGAMAVLRGCPEGAPRDVGGCRESAPGDGERREGAPRGMGLLPRKCLSPHGCLVAKVPLATRAGTPPRARRTSGSCANRTMSQTVPPNHSPLAAATNWAMSVASFTPRLDSTPLETSTPHEPAVRWAEATLAGVSPPARSH